jgi:alkaline phosphatase D
VFHLGDYIYESAREEGLVRRHVGGVLKELGDYRVRHSQYKTDPHLQAMHAHCPWMVTWDDHEVSNDYANDICQEEKIDPAKFLQRRAAAYQAYYEMMPLRHTSLPRGPEMQIYRQAAFGRLANFFVLDGRQYRSDQPNEDRPSELNEGALSSKNTMLGSRQYQWLSNSLTKSPTTWNVMPQQTMMGIADATPDRKHQYSMDHWCGYVAERNKLMRLLHDRKIANPIVLTGDIHSNWVNDLRIDDLKPETPIAAVEFVGTSISSSGNGTEERDRAKALMAENPNVRFFNGERGYVRCTVTPKLWRSDYCTVADVKNPGAPIITRASFVVESGLAGAKPA